MPTINKARFEKLRAAVLAKRAERDAYDHAMHLNYGAGWRLTWLTKTEQTKWNRLCAAYYKAADRMHALLEASPRDWKSGVPTAWVVEELPFEDACKPISEALSVVPPMAYGCVVKKR